MRITNLSGGPIVHHGQLGCDTGNDRLVLDTAGLFPAGEPQTGRSARFKKHVLESIGALRMRAISPKRSDCVGSVGVEETIRSGRAVTVQGVVFARYPLADQPLPRGRTTVTAAYRFSPARSGSKDYDLRVSAPVRIKGRPVDYPAPQMLADAMLADPEFRAWLERRNERANLHPNLPAGPWKDHRAWQRRGYVGGPAPDDTLELEIQAGGSDGDWVRELAIDPWTATVTNVDITKDPGEEPE